MSVSFFLKKENILNIKQKEVFPLQHFDSPSLLQALDTKNNRLVCLALDVYTLISQREMSLPQKLLPSIVYFFVFKNQVCLSFLKF